MKTAWKGMIAAAASAALAVQTSAQFAPPAGPAPSWSDYAAPDRLVALPDGRSLHVLCLGQGSPAVILTAGYGDWALSWRPVHRRLARSTRVCAWDRPGYGFSGPSAAPVDVASTSTDLADLLQTAGIAAPYILVGHSLGAQESLIFADHHPGDVAGMVLVDPSSPDQHRLMGAAAPALRAHMAQGFEAGIGLIRRCRDLLAAGTLTLESDDPVGCVTPPVDWPEAVRAALREQWRTPGRADTRLSFAESTASGRNFELAINAGREFGEMPLIVLTAMRRSSPPDAPPQALAETAVLTVLWRQMHARLAALSSHGEQRFVSGAAHYIHHDRPEAVVSAVESVIQTVRQRSDLVRRILSRER